MIDSLLMSPRCFTVTFVIAEVQLVHHFFVGVFGEVFAALVVGACLRPLASRDLHTVT